MLGSAERLIGLHGPSAVSVDDIVEAAGLAKGTFYNHFVDKDALIHEIALGVRTRLEEDVTAAIRGLTDPAEIVATAMSMFLSYAILHPQASRVLVQDFPKAAEASEKMNRPIQATIERGMAEGRFRAENANAGLVTTIGLVRAGISAIARIDERRAATTLARAMIRAALMALCVPEVDAIRLARAVALSLPQRLER